jgi:hypothetical protein
LFLEHGLNGSNGFLKEAQPGQAGTRRAQPNSKKHFGIRILRIVRIKIKWLESGRFGKSGYHYKIFISFDWNGFKKSFCRIIILPIRNLFERKYCQKIIDKKLSM